MTRSIGELLYDLRSRGIKLRAEGPKLRFDAPKGALIPPLKAELKARKPEILAYFHKAQASNQPGLPKVTPVTRDGDLPLSFAQRRLWFLDRMEGPSPVYNIPIALRFRGELNLEALRASVNAIVDRHESLRTGFVDDRGQPKQVIAERLDVNLTVHGAEGADETTIRQDMNRASREPFDLRTPPLLRVALWRRAADDHFLLAVIHHIVADAWSVGIIVKELAANYRHHLEETAVNLPPMTVHYADFAAWQQRVISHDLLKQQRTWWVKQLTGAPSLLELPTDRPRPAVQRYHGATARFTIPHELTTHLDTIARKHRATLFQTLLATWKILLARYSGRDDIVVGSPIANRNRTEVEPLIGFFVNTLAVHTDLSGQLDFARLLDRVREGATAAYAAEDLPFDKLVEELHPERSLSHAPIFQTIFILQNAPLEDLTLPGLTMERLTVEQGTARFDLTMELEERDGCLLGTLEYSTDLFDAATAERMARCYNRLLQGAATDPTTPIALLPLLDEEERRRILVDWNDTAVEHHGPRCAHSGFEALAAEHPEAPAVQVKGRIYSYGELNILANRIARRLIKLDVGVDDLVCIYMHRAYPVIAGMLGIMKAGAAYVPLDPAYPAERVAYILDDTRAKVVLTSADLAADLENYDGALLDPADPSLTAESADNPPCRDHAENLAYMIYTSGSTGRPKGVMVHHGGLANQLLWRCETFDLGSDARVLQGIPLTFDPSVWQIFWPLTTGNRVVLLEGDEHKDPVYMVDLMKREQIAVTAMVPSMLETMLEVDAIRECIALRHISCGGEGLSVALQERFIDITGRDDVLSVVYGPTEASIDATSRLCRKGGPKDIIHIGRPVTNTRIYLLDRNMQPAPVGVPGALYIAGPGLARGYRNRPGQTADVFVPNPFARHRDDTRLYRSGDLAAWLPDGQLSFLGRIDHQVKVRGFRIELGEVESALSEAPGVTRAVVTIGKDVSGNNQLVAHVQPAGEGRPALDELRTALRENLEARLPGYMVPAIYVFLETFPLLPGGKVDRKALPEPDMEHDVSRKPMVAARNDMEQQLTEIWSAVLERNEPMGIHDNFFEMGGHSLLATRVVARIREIFDVELPVRVLFTAPTIVELAQTLATTPRLDSHWGVAGIERAPRGQGDGPFDFPLSASQRRLWFLDRLEGSGAAAYNIPLVLRLEGRLDVPALRSGFETLIARHEVLRTVFPTRDGEPVQRVLPPSPFELPVIEAAHWETEIREARVRELAAEEVATCFNLAEGPLLRAALVVLGPEEHVLIAVVHHIIADGWSMGIIVTELAAAYSGEAKPEPLPIQYADFSVWQQDTGEKQESQLDYWRKQLAGAPALHGLPTDRPRPAVQSFKGARHHFNLGREVTDRLTTFCRETGVTTFMVLEAALAALVYRFGGGEDLVLGTAIANRNRKETEPLIGFFANTLALRHDLSGDPDFAELLQRVRTVALEGYANQDVPFDTVVDAVHADRNPAYSPLFQIMFALQNAPLGKLELPGLTMSPLEADQVTAMFDLTLSMIEKDGDLEGRVSYSTDLFDRETVEILFRAYRIILTEVTRDASLKLSRIPLQSREERAALIEARQPNDEPEVRFQLAPSDEARRLATALLNRGLKSGDVVGLCLRDPQHIAPCLHAVLSAGGVILALEPNDPPAFNQMLIEEAGALFVLGDDHSFEGVQQLNPADDWREIQPQNLPKIDENAPAVTAHGITLSRRALAGRCAHLADMFDQVPQPTSVAEEGAIEQLLAASCEATPWARTHPACMQAENRPQGEARRKPWARTHPACMQTENRPPGEARRMEDTEEKTQTENTYPSEARRMRARPGGDETQTDNTYPSEARRMRARPGGETPGITLLETGLFLTQDNTGPTVYLLDQHGEPVPAGVTGNIHVAGRYLADSPSTIEDPFVSGRRMIDTGLRGRMRHDGTLLVTETTTTALTIEGRRVQTDKVHAALQAIPAVTESALMVRRSETDELIAYVALSEPKDIRELTAALREKLPQAWLPGGIVPLTRLPRRPDGAVDETALAGLPVLDEALTQNLEAGLKQQAGITDAAVTVETRLQAPPVQHLSDLLPGWSPAGNTTAVNAETEKADAGVEDMQTGKPSVNIGPEITLPEDAPATLPEALRRVVTQYPDHGTGFLDADGNCDFQTYAELLTEAEYLLTGLRELGLQPGDKVIFQLGRNRDFVVGFWACVLAGVIPVPITVPPVYREDNATVLKLKNVWAMLDKPLVLTGNNRADEVCNVAHLFDLEGFRVEIIDELKRSERDTVWHQPKPDDIALFLLTSGSTGLPKAVQQPHKNLLARCAGTAIANHFTPDDISLNWMPLDHVGGIVMFHLRDVFTGGNQYHAHIDPVLQNPLKWLDWIDRYRITATWAPNFAYGLVNDRADEVRRGNWDLSTLRFILNAGEAVVAKTARTFLLLLEQHGLSPRSMFPCWGMSETCSGVTFNHRFSPATTSNDDPFVVVGEPIPGFGFRVTDGKNQPVPEGNVGRLQAKGASVLPGYFNNPRVNAESFTDDGWFDTGDLGLVEDGQLTISGRGKENIIINGVNFYAHELEKVVEEVEGVEVSFTAACAIRTPGTNTDQVAVFFNADGTAEAEMPALLGDIRRKMVRTVGIDVDFLIPVSKETIPKTAIGKIQRTQLGKRFGEGEFNKILRKVDLQLANRNTLPAWTYHPHWAAEKAERGGNGRGSILVIGGSPDLIEEISAEGRHVIPGTIGTFSGSTDEIGAIVLMWTEADDTDALHQLIRLAQTGAASQAALRLLIVTECGQMVQPGDRVDPHKTALPGLLRGIAAELPQMDVTHLDLEPVNSRDILRELNNPVIRSVVAVRDGRRLVRALQPVDLTQAEHQPLPFREGGFYLVTGGLGGLAPVFCRYLLETWKARLLLVGRTPLPVGDRRREALDKQDAVAARIATLQELEMMSGEVRYAACDIDDRAALQALLNETEQSWGRPDGCLNLAATYASRPLTEIDADHLETLLKPRLQGSRNLPKILPQGSLFCDFTSVNGYFGGPGVIAYAAANSLAQGIAAQAAATHRVYSTAWSMWDGLGMAAGFSDTERDMTRARGYHLIGAEQGLHAWLAALAAGESELLIGLDAAKYPMRTEMSGAGFFHRQLTAFTAGRAAAPEHAADRFGTPVPMVHIQVDEIPRDAEGHVDHGRLRAALTATGITASAPPRTATEKKLAVIWQELLGGTRPGIHDNFFEMGGHSLLATRAVSRIRDTFGVDIALAQLFQTPTIAGLAPILETGGEADAQAPIMPVPRTGPVPMSFAQRRLWVIDRLDPGNSGYNIPAALVLRGDLNARALGEALQAVVNRHESLRTTFAERNGEPVQHIAENLTVNLSVTDLRDQADPTARARAAAMAEAREPFDVTSGPLLRAELLQTADDAWVALFTMHHIISDGWSMGVLIGEITALYKQLIAGEEAALPELPIQYADYAQWQLDRENVLADQLDWWKEQLDDMPALLELPTDRPRPAVQTGNGASLAFQLDTAVAESVEALAQRKGATAFMVLEAAFAALLSRYTGRTDIPLGSPIANRNRAETEPLIGFLVNTLVLRNDLSGNPDFLTLLERVKTGALGAFGNQDIPFERVVEALHPERNMGFSPLFQVMFSLQDDPGGSLNLPGVTVEPLELEHKGAKFDLTLMLSRNLQGLKGTFEYSTDLFDRTRIQNMAAHFDTLLKALLTRPSEPAAHHDLMDAETRRTVLETWNDTATPYPADQCVHRLFEAAAAQVPAAIALEICDKTPHTMTYTVLDTRANHLAHYLRDLGVGPDIPVGICLARGFDQIVSLLAVLKAGGAYVPLNEKDPTERLKGMLDDLQLPVIIGRSETLGALPPHHAQTVDPERDAEAISACPADPPHNDATPDNAVYIIFTSGSTGRPKGVVVPHRGVTRLLFGTDYLSRMGTTLHLAAVSFDASTFEIWGALLHGRKCVLYPDVLPEPVELGRVLRDHEVETLFLTTQLFNTILDENPTALQSVREVLTGGEAHTPAYLRRALTLLPETRLSNIYGPTESTTFSTSFPVKQVAEDAVSVPIGGPIGNTTVYVLDRNFRPLPPGIPGELCIGGAGLARGYHNRPGLTAERFVPNPFGRGDRLYRTGDLARFLEDGSIDFNGRIDHQVKLRGFRIELGEIEAALTSLPNVAQAATVLWESRTGNKQLVGYILPEGDPPAGRDPRAMLTDKLPEYMVPASVVVMDRFPVNKNGKLDRKALPQPDELHQEAVPPRTETEKALAEIWSEILGYDRPSIHADFFELGGHSLAATRIVARVRDRFGVDLPLRDLFTNPTIAALAERVAQAAEGRAVVPIEAIPRTGEPLPLSPAQQRLWLATRREDVAASYNIPTSFRLKGNLDVDALRNAFTHLVARHESLRTVFITVEGEPRQSILEPRPSELIVTDMTSESEREKALRTEIDGEAAFRFDLERGPLLRVRLLQTAADEWILLLTMHHIIADGWSVAVLVRELIGLYRGEELPPLTLQYADYGLHCRQHLEHGALAEGRDFWRQHLEHAPPLIALPTDRPRPAHRLEAGGEVRMNLPEELGESLNALARNHNATLFMVLQSAFAVLLQRYGAGNDIVMGAPHANRDNPALEGMIGFFVNMIALRIDLSGNPTFGQLLDRVRETSLNVYRHADVPFDQVVETLDLDRNPAYTPVFQVACMLDNNPHTTLQVPGLTLSPVEQRNDTSKWDLMPAFSQADEQLIGGFRYSTVLFDHETIQRMAVRMERLLEVFAQNPNQRLSDLNLMSPEERTTVLETWNQTAADYPQDRFLPQIIREIAQTSPKTPALHLHDEVITYGQLQEKVDLLARHLQSLGVGPDVTAGVCHERGIDLVIALLAVMTTGGAYLPLDVKLPPERLGFILKDAGAPVLVTRRELCDRFPDGSLEGIETVFSNEPIPKAEATAFPRIHADHMAYMIYTSGSTGKPKGVMVTHGGFANYLNYCAETYTGEARMGSICHGSFAFDATVTAIWFPLAQGRPVHLIPEQDEIEALADALFRVNAGVVKITPAHLEAVARLAPEPDGICQTHTFVIGGEALTHAHLDYWRQHAPQTRFINEYGPTETVVGCSIFESSEAGTGAVPIGKPIANTQLYVLDPAGRPAAPGAPGELYIGGQGLARGYMGRAGLTASRFVPDPFGQKPGGRLYRTGDLVRARQSGDLIFMNRLDDQVKLRGFRIELGEIETVLTNHKRVDQALVLLREDQLIAYAVSHGPHDPQLPKLLTTHLAEHLPEYMVPSAVMMLPEFPLTGNGKIDRRALPQPHAAAESQRIVPRNPLEDMLHELMTAILGVDEISVHDNFFELGGNSIQAMSLINKVKKKLGARLKLNVLFQRNTIAQLAEHLAELSPKAAELAGKAGDKQTAIQEDPIPRLPRTGKLPLSFAQSRLWFLEQLSPGGSTYNVPRPLELKGVLNLEALQQAVTALIQRHEPLRTTFQTRDDEPVQVIAPEPATGLEVVDQSRQDRPMDAIAASVQASATAPFNLAEGPLFRATLYRAADDHHVLLLNAHHIITDGWSGGILVRELSALYAAFNEGRPSPLPPLPVQYADYAAWQHQQLSGENLEKQKTYWQQHLAGAPGLLEIPTDKPRPAKMGYAGATFEFGVSRELTARLNDSARAHKVTLYMLLQAAYAVLLHHYSGMDDILVGTPTAGRNREEIEPLIGFLVNTQIVRNNLSGDPAFSQLLERVRAVVLESAEYRDIPFEWVVDAVQPERSMSHAPLVQAVFSLQNTPRAEIDLPGLTIKRFGYEQVSAKFDLNLAMGELNGRLGGAVEYNTDIFTEQTIANMARHFVNILKAVIADPFCKLSRIPLMDEAERALIDSWNQTGEPLNQNATLPQLVAVQAANTPDAPALRFEGQELTYRDMLKRADHLAAQLAELGVGPETYVGLCCERSLEMPIGILAILRAGGAWLPLDPTLPPDRLTDMLKDAGVELVLAHAPTLDVANQLGATVKSIDRPMTDKPRRAPEPGLKPDHPAYIIYTSGSTGKPKGVVNSHRGIVNRISWLNRSLNITASDRFLQKTPFSFDVSVGEFFNPLTTGACLVLAKPGGHKDPVYLTRILRDEEITNVHFVPSMLEVFTASRPPQLPHLRRILCSGEALNPVQPHRLYEQGVIGRDVPVHNLYGPTEAAVEVTWYPCGPETTAVPIGKPITAVRTHVLDRSGNPCPVGVPGELCLGGVQVARGYVNRPGLTGERFIPDPFSEESGARLYRTGDLTRWQPDGNLAYLGRIDRQVKLRGFRIEPGEIENRLTEAPGVASAAVMIREDMPGYPQLMGYVVPIEGATVAEEDLRNHLRGSLPDYMIPAAVLTLDALPLNISGKLDVKQLPAPVWESRTQTYTAPRNPDEEAMAEVWAEILGVNRVGMNDDFFSLGGHSLLAVRLMSRIRERFGVELPLAALFEGPTAASLTALLKRDQTAWSPLVPIRTEGDKPPLFAVHPGGGNVLVYGPLARHLGDNQPFYGLQARGLEEGWEPLETVEEMGALYLDHIKSVRPQGPYHLIGLSLGGVIALEIAQRLKAAGEEVAFLGLLDTFAPKEDMPIRDELDLLVGFAQALAESAGGKLTIDPDTLRPLNEEARLKLIIEGAAAQGALPKGTSPDQGARLWKVNRSNRRANDNYEVKLYDGAVTLFRAQEKLPDVNQDHAAVWQRYAAEGVRVIDVPGAHTTMVEDPHAKTLAMELIKSLKTN